MLRRDSWAMVGPAPKLRRATTITKALLGRQLEVSVLSFPPFFYFYFCFSFSFSGSPLLVLRSSVLNGASSILTDVPNSHKKKFCTHF